MVSRVAAWAALLLLAGCATQNKRDEADLTRLLEWYPGRYTNIAEAEERVLAGQEQGTLLELNIVLVYAPFLGKHAFYLQENVADEPLRIIAQRIVTFDVVEDVGIVQRNWAPVEPIRWRDAHLNLDLFKSMQPQDFTALDDCDLTWSAKAERFVGKNDPKNCRISNNGGQVQMDVHAQLTASELALAAYPMGKAPPNPYLHFRKN